VVVVVADVGVVVADVVADVVAVVVAVVVGEDTAVVVVDVAVPSCARVLPEHVRE
jgi:hypothetical protein